MGKELHNSLIDERSNLRKSLINLYTNVGTFLSPVLIIFLLLDQIFNLELTWFQILSTLLTIITSGVILILKSKNWIENSIITIHTIFIFTITTLYFGWYLFEPGIDQMLSTLVSVLILGLVIIRTRFTILYFSYTAIGFILIYFRTPELELNYFLYYILCATAIIVLSFWRENLYRETLLAQVAYKNIFSDSQELIFVLNNNLEILEMNKSAENYTSKFDDGSVFGKTFNKIFCGKSHEDRKLFKDAIEELNIKNLPVKFEATCDCFDSKEFIPKEFSIRKSIYFEQEVIIISIRIIKELKQKEQNLIESREKITQVLENINSFVYNITYDHEGIIFVNYVSPKVKEILGIEIDEYISRVKSGRVGELFHPDDKERIDKRFDTILNKKKKEINKLRIERNGDQRWLEEKIFPKILDNQTTVSFFGIVTDVTERERNHIKLAASERQFRQIFERNLAGVYKTHVHKGIIDCNKAFANILGYSSAAELKNQPILDIYHIKEDRAAYIKELRNKGSLNNYITLLKKKNGKKLITINNVSIFPDENGELNNIEGVLIDVTELQETTEALQLSEEKYRLLFEESNNAIFLLTFGQEHNRIIDTNQLGCDLFGFKKENLIGASFSDFLIEPEKSKRINSELEKKGKIEDEWIFNRKNKETFEAEISITKVSMGDDNIAQVIIKDISQRKNSERALKESRIGFKNIVDNSPAAILIFTEQKLAYLNPQGEVLYRSHLNSKAKNIEKVFPEEHKYLIKVLSKDAKNHLNSYTEIDLGKGKSKMNFSINIVNTVYNNKKSQLILLRDITLQNEYNNQKHRAEVAEKANRRLQEEIDNHKQTQLSLIEKTSRLNALFQGSSSLYIVSLNNDYKLVDYNTNFGNFIKSQLNIVVEKNIAFLDIFQTTKKGKETILRKFDDVFKGNTHEIITFFPGKKGMIWMESFINPIIIKGEKIKEISLISHDITEKIESEQKIKLSEANNRAILLAMPDALFRVNKDGIITEANIGYEGSRTILKKITSVDAINGKHLRDVFKSKEISTNILHYILKTLETDEVLKHTYSIEFDNDEAKIHLENRYSKMNDEEVIIILRNITDTVEYEDNLIESVKEKEVLLQEVHHRVKNNLQVINSILNLQSSYVDDEKTLEIINESQNRIRSMSYIHETLYRTTDFASINFGEYVTNLVKNLVHSYELFNDRTELKTDIEEVNLALDQAIPCGLILNELVSNSLKYAYPNRNEGVISINVKNLDKKIHLVVEDFGIGLPKGFQLENADSLGISLVHSLVEQLDGELILKTKHGTKFLIIFEKQEL